MTGIRFIYGKAVHLRTAAGCSVTQTALLPDTKRFHKRSTVIFTSVSREYDNTGQKKKAFLNELRIQKGLLHIYKSSCIPARFPQKLLPGRDH